MLRQWLTTAAAASVIWASTASAADVWIGGSRAWGDYTTPGNETKWAFLRDAADGLYINNFAMRPEESDTPSRADRIRGMHRLLKNKKLFYETDLKHSTDDFDRDAIATLTKAGFAYTAVTINYGTDDRRTRLITQNGKVPLFYMFGPWNGDGDISKPKNADLRTNVLQFAGAAVDSPVVVWRGKTGKNGTKPMVYSTVKWCHENNRKFLYLLAPNESGPNFLAEAQALVREMEDNDANPDVWAVAFYGPQAFRDKLDTLPEADAAGRPAKTFSGAAYWLIHHLRDPKRWATLSLPDGPAAAFDTGRPRTIEIDVANASDWLDLTPLLRLTDAAGYAAAATLDGRDVTAELTGNGVVLNRHARLQPGTRRRLAVTLTRTSAVAGPTPAVTLSPHSSERDRVNQTLPLATAAVAGR